MEFKIKFRKFGIGQAQNSKCEPRFPRTATEDELRAAFAAYGTLESVSIVKKDNKFTGEAYGFANFIKHEAAAHCLEALKSCAVILKDADGTTMDRCMAPESVVLYGNAFPLGPLYEAL